jgi:hypothetical protein
MLAISPFSPSPKSSLFRHVLDSSSSHVITANGFHPYAQRMHADAILKHRHMLLLCRMARALRVQRDSVAVTALKRVFNYRWLVQLLVALDFIHEDCRILHRDLKPQNIFLGANDVIKLGDLGKRPLSGSRLGAKESSFGFEDSFAPKESSFGFETWCTLSLLNLPPIIPLSPGIAKVLDKSLDMARTVVGTPYYMSPELCRNERYG